MTEENNKLAATLNQIKHRQTVIAERIGQLKETAPPETIADLEKIEAEAWRTVIAIEDAARKLNEPLIARIERNTILFRMKSKPFSGQRFGDIIVG
jgi:hypothetical protein